MTFPDNIVLRKSNEPEPKVMPFGIYAIKLGDRIIFVRRLVGRFVPVSIEEQKEFEKLL